MPLDQEHLVKTLLAARLRISAAIWSITHDAGAAEDIFQNVAVKALTGKAQFESEAPLISWAFITARHAALNWLRAQKNQPLCLDDSTLELLDREWANDLTPSTGIHMENLLDCLEQLPERSRQLLQIRYFDGASCQEVSQQLNLGLDAVYQRLSRLHHTLRLCMEKRMSAVDVRLTPDTP